MLYLISPAKRLDFATGAPIRSTDQPEFMAQSAELVNILRAYSPVQLAQLMGLSDPLAALNFGRYAQWHQPFTPANAKAAIFAFRGDVFRGLDVDTLATGSLGYLQKHLRILSGLYGLLRSRDLIQPYRLEMGTKLPNPGGTTLYQYWGGRLTEALNRALAGRRNRIVVNLASNEYFKAIQKQTLNAQLITPSFKDWKNGQYKMISFYAKRARGLMLRYAAEHRLSKVEQLQQFDLDGYVFAPEMSTEHTWVFSRRH